MRGRMSAFITVRARWRVLLRYGYTENVKGMLLSKIRSSMIVRILLVAGSQARVRATESPSFARPLEASQTRSQASGD